jgi:hypothetical protein
MPLDSVLFLVLPCIDSFDAVGNLMLTNKATNEHVWELRFGAYVALVLDGKFCFHVFKAVGCIYRNSFHFETFEDTLQTFSFPVSVEADNAKTVMRPVVEATFRLNQTPGMCVEWQSANPAIKPIHRGYTCGTFYAGEIAVPVVERASEQEQKVCIEGLFDFFEPQEIADCTEWQEPSAFTCPNCGVMWGNDGTDSEDDGLQ